MKNIMNNLFVVAFVVAIYYGFPLLFCCLSSLLKWFLICLMSVISVCVSRMPVSIVIASYGVDCGTWSILFIT